MRTALSIIFILMFNCVSSQTTDSILANKERQINMLKWMAEITELGVEQKGDSITFSKEFLKVMNDTSYRDNIIYPKKYNWPLVKHLIKHDMLKQTYWHFINLYTKDEESKKMVIKSILAYDSAFQMDKMLLNAFYTYAFLDPEVSVLKDGMPEIIRPDLLEDKMNALKEMVAYIKKYRATKSEG